MHLREHFSNCKPLWKEFIAFENWILILACQKVTFSNRFYSIIPFLCFLANFRSKLWGLKSTWTVPGQVNGPLELNWTVRMSESGRPSWMIHIKRTIAEANRKWTILGQNERFLRIYWMISTTQDELHQIVGPFLSGRPILSKLLFLGHSVSSFLVQSKWYEYKICIFSLKLTLSMIRLGNE